jgi:superfamily II DNA or RNA helicase
MAECTYVARPYNAVGIRHLLQHPHGGLLQDPGTGKTGECLAAMQILKKRRLVDHMLVVAPLNPVYEVWPAEVKKWSFPFTVEILHGKNREKALARKLAGQDADIYATNYDNMEWLVEHARELLGRDERWWLVLDESTKVKHSNTKRFKMLKLLLPLFARRTILTGTPAPNGLLDLFGQVYAVDLGASLGRYVTQYRRAFFYPSGYMGYDWVPQEGAEKRIYERLGDRFYRVSDSVLKLPPMHRVPLYVSLPTKARKIYDRLEEEFVAELKKGTVTAVNAGVLSSKLRQAANGIIYGDGDLRHKIHDEKLVAVGGLLEQLQGNPLLIGYEFTADGTRLAKEFGLPLVNGDTPRKEKSRLFSEFNKGRLPGLVVQTGAAAHGLNLQEVCHTVALYGLTWNLETYIQFNKRVHRSGQRNTVIVHHVIARDTIDETVWEVLGQKDRRQAALLNAIKRRYTK